MTTAASGRTNSCKCGETISSPSSAESTETAGVMMPSPKNRQAPEMPTKARMTRSRSLATPRWARAIRARMPPSPRLSARMTSMTYLTVTTRINDQKISERTPSTSHEVTPVGLKCSILALKA